jgi:hypothetical protein
VIAAGVAALALVGGGAARDPAVRAAGGRMPASRSLAALLHDHAVRAHPSAGAHRVGSIGRRRPLTHVRTVLPVLGTAIAGDGTRWLRVPLPGRPNGRAGWISAEGTRASSTEWYLSVRLSTRRLTVFRDGLVARRFRVVVGKASTATPRGRFFVEEAVALGGSVPGGPFALATSARSTVLQEFHGGPGQIALHGVAGLSGALGSASSHGCVRLSTRAITWLAQRIGAGVSLTVTG